MSFQLPTSNNQPLASSFAQFALVSVSKMHTLWTWLPSWQGLHFWLGVWTWGYGFLALCLGPNLVCRWIFWKLWQLFSFGFWEGAFWRHLRRRTFLLSRSCFLSCWLLMRSWRRQYDTLTSKKLQTFGALSAEYFELLLGGYDHCGFYCH